MLDVLKNYGEITLLTLEPFQPSRIDDYYGTSLQGADIRPVLVHDPILDLFGRLKLPSGLLRLHVLMRASKNLLQTDDSFDLVCSGYDEQDLGAPCIQYIHYPWNLYPRPDAPPGWNDHGVLSRTILIYNFLCRLYSGFSPSRVCQNLTLVNSAWTGEKARTRYPDLDYLVVNPPALAEMINDNGSRRQERFLTIGRCSHEKEWLKLIDIVKGLRERGHDVGLTLSGSRDSAYYEQQIKERIQAEGGWVSMALDFTRDELQAMLRTHRYGIHGMREEHYGMAVAELILGGCLTMVPDDGGQVEIVTNPALRYSSVEEAVEKFDRVLRSSELKHSLLAEQQATRYHLTTDRFLQEFEQVVQVCLERGVSGALRGLQEGHFSDFSRFSVSR